MTFIDLIYVYSSMDSMTEMTSGNLVHGSWYIFQVMLSDLSVVISKYARCTNMTSSMRQFKSQNGS